MVNGAILTHDYTDNLVEVEVGNVGVEPKGFSIDFHKYSYHRR